MSRSTRELTRCPLIAKGCSANEIYMKLVRVVKRRMTDFGMEDLSLRGNHLLLSIDRDERLARDDEKIPLVRICNFELLKRA